MLGSQLGKLLPIAESQLHTPCELLSCVCQLLQRALWLLSDQLDKLLPTVGKLLPTVKACLPTDYDFLSRLYLLLQEVLWQRCWAASMASCSQLWRAGFAQIVSASRTKKLPRGLGRRASHWLQRSLRSQCSQTDTWPFTNDAANDVLSLSAAWCWCILPQQKAAGQRARSVTCHRGWLLASLQAAARSYVLHGGCWHPCTQLPLIVVNGWKVACAQPHPLLLLGKD